MRNIFDGIYYSTNDAVNKSISDYRFELKGEPFKRLYGRQFFDIIFVCSKKKRPVGRIFLIRKILEAV
jgi:hypothetical protein